MPIGIFDSGIGGLTVVKEIQSILPRERLIYFGDTARVPYGSKSRETVRRYSVENAQLLASFGVKMIVIACNTSSATALEKVQKVFDGPVVDVVGPGVRAAVAATRNQRIGIIATQSTIRSKAYQRGIALQAPEVKTFAKACPLLVPLAEEGWQNSEPARLIVEKYLRPLLRKNIDTLVMGCTHYPLLSDTLRTVVGPETRLVSSASETAKAVHTVLSEMDLLNRKKTGIDLFLASDSISRFKRFHKRILQSTSQAEFRLAKPFD